MSSYPFCMEKFQGSSFISKLGNKALQSLHDLKYTTNPQK
jgi:hypothetical protein